MYKKRRYAVVYAFIHSSIHQPTNLSILQVGIYYIALLYTNGEMVQLRWHSALWHLQNVVFYDSTFYDIISGIE